MLLFFKYNKFKFVHELCIIIYIVQLQKDSTELLPPLILICAQCREQKKGQLISLWADTS